MGRLAVADGCTRGVASWMWHCSQHDVLCSSWTRTMLKCAVTRGPASFDSLVLEPEPGRPHSPSCSPDSPCGLQLLSLPFPMAFVLLRRSARTHLIASPRTLHTSNTLLHSRNNMVPFTVSSRTLPPPHHPLLALCHRSQAYLPHGIRHFTSHTQWDRLHPPCLLPTRSNGTCSSGHSKRSPIGSPISGRASASRVPSG
jgi:hypothetical protein